MKSAAALPQGPQTTNGTALVAARPKVSGYLHGTRMKETIATQRLINLLNCRAFEKNFDFADHPPNVPSLRWRVDRHSRFYQERAFRSWETKEPHANISDMSKQNRTAPYGSRPI
jgi:hypothetical protein